MSNYFDGLIRASGLAAGSYPLPAAVHGMIEIEAQHDAPPTAIPAASIGDKDEELVSTDSPLMPSDLDARPLSDSQDLGQAMVHAALRWVMADGDSPGALTAVALESAPPNPVQASTNNITAPVRPAASQPGAEPMTGVTTRLPEAPIPLRVAPIRHPESTDRLPHRPSGTRQPPAKEEVVEVSIGAIHLRVDAPPPQTVVQAPAPSPRPPPDRPPRSTLSRRALRRL